MKFPPATDIRKIRVGMDVTQMELASRSGISQGTIAKIERGKISASYETVVKLFETLDTMQQDIGKGLTASDVCSKGVVSIQSTSSIQEASAFMRQKGYSQLPVFSEDTPVGSISERGIFELISREKSLEKVNSKTVSEVMGESFPVVSDNTPVGTVAGLMNSYNAILVSKKGSIIGIITSADMLKLI
jgi:predicted transcriptional regulator